MKIRRVEGEMFHSDGQTDRHDEANSRFWQICERASILNVTVKFSELFPYLFRSDLTKSIGATVFNSSLCQQLPWWCSVCAYRKEWLYRASFHYPISRYLTLTVGEVSQIYKPTFSCNVMIFNLRRWTTGLLWGILFRFQWSSERHWPFDK